MTDQNDTQTPMQPAIPNPDLKTLNRLVGTWQVSGGAEGTTRYEWMEGGFFLIQHVDLGGEKGIEIIGHEQKYGQDPSPEIKSRYYGAQGSTFDYVYEIQGDTLMIWFGDRGSPAYYKGTFSADGNTLTGEWVYPGGGGYQSVSTRIR
jgi:hypothetical protein